MNFLPAPGFSPLRVYSDGAGTQSVATMVLQAMGKLPKPYDVFVFANVGDDSENPETLAYRRDYVIPFAERHGLNLVERQRIYKGKPITLLEFLRAEKKSISIPIFFFEGGKGTRKCTSDFKIEVVQRYVKSLKPTHVELGLGFSAEEGHRTYQKMRGWHDRHWSRDKKTGVWKPGDKLGFWQLYEFPLAQLRLRKADCIALVKEAGLPEPPPSLCWFCPFTRRSVWAERRRRQDWRYRAGIELENLLNAKYQDFRARSPHRSKRIGLHPDRVPLAEIGDQLTLWDEYMDSDEGCDVGVCGL